MPLFFRGSILVSEGVISFTEFQSMRYCDFVKIEATHYYILKVKNGSDKKTKTDKNEKVKQELSGLDEINIDDLGLPKEYTDIL